jgi:hypothetical protein
MVADTIPPTIAVTCDKDGVAPGDTATVSFTLSYSITLSLPKFVTVNKPQ